MDRCFACGKRCGTRHLVDTRDAQKVYVGRSCYRKVQAAGPDGYQPPLGGPALWPICRCSECKTHATFETAADCEFPPPSWGEEN